MFRISSIIANTNCASAASFSPLVPRTITNERNPPNAEASTCGDGQARDGGQVEGLLDLIASNHATSGLRNVRVPQPTCLYRELRLPGINSTNRQAPVYRPGCTRRPRSRRL